MVNASRGKAFRRISTHLKKLVSPLISRISDWAKTKGGRKIANLQNLLNKEAFSVTLTIILASGLLLLQGGASGQPITASALVKKYAEEGAIIGLRFSEVQAYSLSAAQFVNSESTPIANTDFISTTGQNALLAYSSSDNQFTLEEDKPAQILIYTVRPGDNLTFIASDFGISLNTIISANSLKDINSLNPGEEIKIPSVDGIIYRVKAGDTVGAIASRYQSETDRIISLNGLSKSGALREGEEIVIPDGRAIIAQKSQKIVTLETPAGGIGGLSGITDSYEGKLPREYRRNASSSRFAHLPDLGDYFIVPTTGYDWGVVHDWNGVDIANKCGTPVLAAAAGVVTVADEVGWNGGFGKYVKIAHDNGTETIYGHLSKIEFAMNLPSSLPLNLPLSNLPSNSDGKLAVAKGQIIGLMGRSGNSTGCHLHFEVHGAKNPLTK